MWVQILSGFFEIESWALDNVPIELEDTFEAWRDRIADDFEANGRLPLNQIFSNQDFIDLETTFDIEHAEVIRLEEEQPITAGMEALFG